MEKDDQEHRNSKIREQVGVLLLCLVLAGSGILLIRGSSVTSPISFTESKTSLVPPSPSSQAGGSVAGDKATTVDTKSTPLGKQTISDKININTASMEDLDRLPGVGPATAQKIIDYRTQNGPFPTIEALDNVSGIGPSKYAEMKDLITI